MAPVIRQLNQADVETVFVLGKNESNFCVDRSQPVFWSKEQLSTWFDSPNDVCLGAFMEDKLVGFALVGIHPPTKKATWENLLVIPEARGDGISDLLEQALRQRLKDHGVTHVQILVPDENVHALHYFRKQAYRECGLFYWFSV